MARAFNNELSKLINSQEFSDVILTLVTIQTDSETIRLVRSYEDVVSNGRTFQGYDLTVGLPDENDETVPSVTLELGAGDTTLIEFFRAANDSPKCTIEYVLVSDPNNIQMSFDYDVRATTVSKGRITAELSFEPALSLIIPNDQFTPRLFPALFP